MNKILTSVALISGLTVILLIIIFKNRIPFGRSNSSFGTDPLSEITQIEFSDKERELSLVKNGDEWLINGTLEVRKSSIFFIERILREMKIKSPVSEELFYKEITEKGIKPLRVRVYAGMKMINSFFVYKTRSNSYGNIMKKRERSKPFIVFVPGYDNDIGSVFTLNEFYWQPYKVFNLLPSEIYSIIFDNIADSASSFSIVSEDHKYNLSGIEGNLSGWDSTLVTRYLSYFTMIPFESWAFDLESEEKDYIESQKPLYIITVVNTKGFKTVLTLWKRISAENNTFDSDRLFGKTDDMENLFIMRYFDIDPIIKKKSYFFPQ